jgi:hypothetical protein
MKEVKEWNGRDWPDGFADIWRCTRCGQHYGGATTGKPPARCKCPDDGAIVFTVPAVLPVREAQQDAAWHLMDRIYKKVCEMTPGMPQPTTAFYDFGVPILAAALSPSRPTETLRDSKT